MKKPGQQLPSYRVTGVLDWREIHACNTVGECPAPLRAGLLGLRVVSPPIPRASTLQGSHLNLSDLDQRAAQAQCAKGGISFFQASLRLFLKSVLLSIACRRYFLLNNKVCES